VIVTSCCRCNISEAEAVELKHYKSVWAREDSTGVAPGDGTGAYFTGVDLNAPEGKDKCFHQNSHIKEKLCQ